MVHLEYVQHPIVLVLIKFQLVTDLMMSFKVYEFGGDFFQ